LPQGTADNPKYAESILVKPKANTRFAHRDMALHFAGLFIEFVQSSARSHPEVSFSVFATRSDGVVGERGEVGGVMNIILQLAAIWI
jgi:hypothetical protein